MRESLYAVEFVHRTTGERRAYTVYAYNKLDADVAGAKRIERDEGPKWRGIWWAYGSRKVGS